MKLQTTARKALFAVTGVALAAALAGCGSVGAGIGVGIPIGPFSLGVGLGSGGLSAGVGTGVGGASVGVGVGTSKVLHDPNRPQSSAPEVAAPSPVSDDQSGAVQWRDARGQPVSACKAEGRC